VSIAMMTTQICNLGASVPIYATRAAPNVAAWLDAAGIALAVTTYQNMFVTARRR
jgi:hypothetical protein